MVSRFERFSYAIFAISRHWNKIAAEEMKKYDLKGSYAVYLVTMLRNKEGITATRLGELCSKDKADISRAVSVMEKKGLVKRDGANHHYYRALLKLTEEGTQAAEQVQKRAQLVVELAGRDLTEERRQIMYETLESIASNLQILCEEGLPDEYSKETIL
jgi:DNA-binding MarR family transcriptional regulator